MSKLHNNTRCPCTNDVTDAVKGVDDSIITVNSDIIKTYSH